MLRRARIGSGGTCHLCCSEAFLLLNFARGEPVAVDCVESIACMGCEYHGGWLVDGLSGLEVGRLLQVDQLVAALVAICPIPVGK